MKKIITTFEEIVEIYEQIKEDNFIHGDLFEVLNRGYIPYKETWKIIYYNAMIKWLESDNNVFTGEILLEHIKEVF